MITLARSSVRRLLLGSNAALTEWGEASGYKKPFRRALDFVRGGGGQKNRKGERQVGEARLSWRNSLAESRTLSLSVMCFSLGAFGENRVHPKQRKILNQHTLLVLSMLNNSAFYQYVVVKTFIRARAMGEISDWKVPAGRYQLTQMEWEQLQYRDCHCLHVLMAYGHSEVQYLSKAQSKCENIFLFICLLGLFQALSVLACLLWNSPCSR